ncbi:MAG: hypothetical protein K2X82_13800 [Gemmataceae bacterium]|nr:hypothetical protein [Gemmataceae bacterium]
MTPAVLLLAALAPAAPVPPDPWAGQRVFPAAFNQVLRDADGNEVGRWPGGAVYVVRSAGTRLEVYRPVTAGPTRVWVEAAEVVKAADAAKHYGDRLAAGDDPVWARFNRAAARALGGDHAGAVEDMTAVVGLRPVPGAYVARGHYQSGRGEYAAAAADLAEALRLNPNDTGALNNLAWLLATCPDPKLRDGKRAVELAARVVAASDGKVAGHVDTLAAAHAEAGDFAEAVKHEKRALADPGYELTSGKAARARLALYEAGKPYREGPTPKK